MSEQAITEVKFRQKKLVDVAWKLNSLRWAMYEMKLNTEMGKILGAIIYLAGSEVLLSENQNDLRKLSWLTKQLIELGYNRQLATETIKKLVSRTTPGK